MNKNNTVFLKYILDAIGLTESYLKDKSCEEFEGNRWSKFKVDLET